MKVIRTAEERWLAERDLMLKMAEIGDDGPQDKWTWKMLFWWATPDAWDDEVIEEGDGRSTK